MSYIFDVDGQTVWSPATRIGQLYVGAVEIFEILVRRKAGISAMAEDFYQLDGDAFMEFVEVIISDPVADHPVYIEMARGFVATSVVMLGRSGRVMPIPATDASLGEVIERLSSAMPDL